MSEVKIHCPSCYGSVITRNEHGDYTCAECGFFWGDGKAFSSEEVAELVEKRTRKLKEECGKIIEKEREEIHHRFGKEYEEALKKKEDECCSLRRAIVELAKKL